MGDEDPVEDVLYLGCTRPALLWGVPLDAVALVVTAPMVAWMVTNDWRLLALSAPLFLVLRELVRHDYNRLRVLRLGWLARLNGQTTWFRWRGTTQAPLRNWRHNSRKDR